MKRQLFVVPLIVLFLIALSVPTFARSENTYFNQADDEDLGIINSLIFIVILGAIAFFSSRKEEEAQRNGKGHRDRYGRVITLWSFVFYFSMVFLGICLFALFSNL